VKEADTLRELIDCIEHAEGPDEMLDRHIAIAAGKSVMRQFTASVDAAISLLPDGAIWRKFTDASMSTYAASPFNAAAQVRHDGHGATPALQLCAAALRVRLAPLEKIEAAERRKAVA